MFTAPRMRFSLLAGGLLGVLALPALAAPTPQEVWSKMMAAYGGETRLKNVLTGVFVRKISGDVEGTSTTWIKENKAHTEMRMKVVFDNGIGRRVNILDPQGSWMLDQNGWDHLPEPGGDEDDRMDLLASEVPFSLVEPTGLTLLGLQEIATDDGPCHLLTVSFPGESGGTLLIHGKTHRLQRAVTLKKDGEYAVAFSDYRSVQGVPLPYRFVTTNPQGVTQTSVMLSAALDLDLPDALLARPARVTPPLRWPDGVDRILLPSQVGGNGQVAVQVTVTGQTEPLTFLLDSAAAGSMVNPRAVAHLSLATAVAGRMQGVGSSHPLIYDAKIPEAAVGGLTLTNRVWALNDIGMGIDGILGYDFFRGVVLAISYRDRSVTAIRPDRYTPPANAIVMTLSLANNLPTVAVQLNGVRATLAVDFGSNGEITLFRPFVTHQGWREGRGGQARGAGGAELTGSIALTHFLLGQTAWPPMTAMVVKGGNFPDGLMGAPLFLRLAEVHFDYESHRLVLVPKAWLGVRCDAQTLTVVSPLPGSPAEQAGLQQGDRLMKIDGQDIVTYAAFLQSLLRRTAGDTITLTIQRRGATLDFPIKLTSSFQ